jgi:transglutaminase-like putative cysteine protease
MNWRIQVQHRSHYRYAGEVTSSYNEARITPLTTVDQLVLDSVVTVSPGSRPLRYIDYWGSVVHSFDLQLPHSELVVTGRSIVETSDPPAPARHLSWQELSDARLRDDFAEYLVATPAVPVDPRLCEIGRSLRSRSQPVTAGAAVVEWVRSQLSYVQGTTGVHTSALEAWEGRSGVCQDFAHLTLAVLRSMGLPSRYCSGYLHPDPEAGVGVAVEGQSHAWIELWSGDWHGFDPTIGRPIGERHVLVARGRDYSDVTPLKGIFHGGPTTSLDVSVRLARIG